jgi:hypothetical protein
MLKRTVAVVAAIVSTTLAAADWDRGPSSTAEVYVDTNTVGPSMRFAGASGVWVIYSPTMSVDCSPPRGCLANRQYIYYVFSCSPRYAIPIERVSMDLNGTVINHEVRDQAYGYGTAVDGGAVRVLNTYCAANVRLPWPETR